MKRKKANSVIIRLLILLVLLVSLIATVGSEKAFAKKSSESPFQIDFIDVGQGDSALVRCDDHYMLVDGGNSKQSSRIYSILKNRCINYLDIIVATHPDDDHIGGLSGALNYATVGEVYSTVTEHDTKTFKNFVKHLNQQGCSITIPKVGETFKIGSATATILGPRSFSPESNNNSIVLRIVYGNTSFLLMGDAEIDEENSIINSGQTVQSTVLKIAHHGSDSSTGYRFIRSVAPQYAVISVGSGNTYGHPTENVLSRLRDADVKTYRTDLQGDITCTSDGDTVVFSVKNNADADALAGSGLGQKSDIQGIDAYNVKNGQTATNSTDMIAVDQTGINSSDLTESEYVLNTNTHKFHHTYCNSVAQMKDKNKVDYTGLRDDVIAQGYVPCKNCNP